MRISDWSSDVCSSDLDVTTQVGLLRARKNVIREHHTSALFVSHDLSVVAQIADRIAVMLGGHLIETETTASILAQPRHDYTRQLMAACRRWPAAQRSESAPAEQAEAYLRARDILAVYPGKLAKSLAARPAIEDISLDRKGVGEG